MRITHGTKIGIALFALSLLGIALSAYLLILHYLPGPSFCAVNTMVNCDIVNKGLYGEIAGIPVALIGLLGYLALAAATVSLLLRPSRVVLWLFRIASTVGFLFSLWLLYLELFVLLAICPFCMASLILITIIMSLAWSVEPPSAITLNIEH